MKKLFLVILSIIYLITTTGFTVNMHYCMGKLVDWVPWSVNADKCSYCGMEKSIAKDSGCCKDQHTQIKLDSDQKMGAMAFKFLQLPLAVPLLYIEVPSRILTSTIKQNPALNAASLSASIPVHVRNCVYLI